MPCSPLSVNRRFGASEFCLSPVCSLVSCSAYSSTLKMEAICSFKTSVGFQRTTRRYIPEDGTVHNHRCENLKPQIKILIYSLQEALPRGEAAAQCQSMLMGRHKQLSSTSHAPEVLSQGAFQKRFQMVQRRIALCTTAKGDNSEGDNGN
jgi:hypothetical protein